MKDLGLNLMIINKKMLSVFRDFRNLFKTRKEIKSCNHNDLVENKCFIAIDMKLNGYWVYTTKCNICGRILTKIS